jgi:hypothetical protein
LIGIRRRIWVFWLAAALFAGCGVKAPPRPPKRLPPAAVSDLSGVVEAGSARLTWSIPAAGKDAGEAVGFAVYRSKTPIAEAECRDCPLTFTQLDQVAITPSDRQAGRMTYPDPLEEGFRYRYRLRAFDAYGSGGGDSNTVSVDY